MEGADFTGVAIRSAPLRGVAPNSIGGSVRKLLRQHLKEADAESSLARQVKRSVDLASRDGRSSVGGLGSLHLSNSPMSSRTSTFANRFASRPIAVARQSRRNVRPFCSFLNFRYSRRSSSELTCLQPAQAVLAPRVLLR